MNREQIIALRRCAAELILDAGTINRAELRRKVHDVAPPEWHIRTKPKRRNGRRHEGHVVSRELKKVLTEFAHSDWIERSTTTVSVTDADGLKKVIAGDIEPGKGRKRGKEPTNDGED